MGMIQVMQSLLMAQPHKESVTGTNGLVTFDTFFKTPTKVTCEFSPVQEGTGDPSPDNVRPISGWTGCDIYIEKNNSAFPHLVNWGQKLEDTLASWSGTTYVGKRIEDGWMVIRTSTSSQRSYGISQSTTIVEGHVYIFKAIIENLVSNQAYYIGASPTKTYSLPKNVETTVSWCFLSAVDYTTWTIRKGSFAADAGDIFRVKNIMLFDLTEIFGEETASYVYGLEQEEEGAGVAWFNSIFPNEYYEYNDGEQMTVSEVNGDPYEALPITFTDPSTGDPMTVYGGTLTINEDGSGTLVTDRMIRTLGQLSTRIISDNTIRIAAVSGMRHAPILASHFNYITSSGLENSIWFPSSSQNTLYAKLESTSTTEEIEQFLTENANTAQFVFTIANPVTYTLSAAEVGQIMAFLGTNNIWHDMNGSITAEYWKKQ